MVCLCRRVREVSTFVIQMELHPPASVSPSGNVNTAHISRKLSRKERWAVTLHENSRKAGLWYTARQCPVQNNCSYQCWENYKTITFLKENHKMEVVPKNVSNESQGLEDNFSALAFRVGLFILSSILSLAHVH